MRHFMRHLTPRQNHPTNVDRENIATALQVIAVPAHFDNVQRQATLRAAKVAGLENVQLLQGEDRLIKPF
jgi:hypothetical protein